jgi:hypothetical protein
MDYSPFYYTYSTISQTLAGAFGFLGAVIVYKTQEIQVSVEQFGKALVTYSPTELEQPFKSARTPGGWVRFLEKARSLTPELGAWHPLGSNAECLAALTTQVDLLLAIKKSLRRSLLNTTATIATCFICMPLTNKDTYFGRPLVAWTVLGGVVLYAIVTLWSYYPLVKDLVQLGREGKED